MILLLVFILGNSCRKDLAYAPSAGNLEFSRDTVYLDTIFANIGSSTRTLKIYNRNRDDIEIPSISLAKGLASKYRLNVDGVAGKEFVNIPIFAQDSIFIFIETTIPPDASSAVDFLYTDAIQFDTGEDLQQVELVTLVKDAIFLYPKTLPDGSKESISLGYDEAGNEIRVSGSMLSNEHLIFTNEKPYVIYGYAAVPSGQELLINAGARVHFHKDSGIYVGSGAVLEINGALSEDQIALENEVVFEGDRLENEYDVIPGQWGTIWIASGSTENTINYLTIKNATIGLTVEGDGLLEFSTLNIQNSKIYNSLSSNLWAKTASINAQNIILGNSGETSLHCNIGGKYSFTHCTIANYWSNGFRVGSALEIDNYNSDAAADLTKAEFVNCIIDGNSFLELVLNENEINTFSYSFTNCMLKFRDDSGQFMGDDLYDFQNNIAYDQVLLNQDANFLEPSKNNFRIGNTSAALNKGNLDAALLVPLDILGKNRTTSPAIGAYQTLQ